MKELRFGIIGSGKIGEFHADVLKNIPGCKLVAASNHTKPKLDAFCDRHGIKGYVDVEEMIKAEKLDAVTVCTPHPSHADLTVKAASLGCHVLIEKPLALTVDECDAMIKAGEENHVLIGTLVQRRNYLPCLRLKRAIEQGKIGKPVLGEVIMLGWRSAEYYNSDPWRGTWSGEGGGVLVTQASHQIDLLCWYMGEIDSIYGIYDNYNHPTIEVEDTAVAVIKFKNGGMATILASNSQNPPLYGKVHIYGDNGASIGVQTDGGQMFIAGVTTIAEPPVLDLWTVKGEEKLLEAYNAEDIAFWNSIDQMRYFHQEHVRNFAAAIRGEEKLIADAYDGRAETEICQAIYTITKNGGGIWRNGAFKKI